MKNGAVSKRKFEAVPFQLLFKALLLTSGGRAQHNGLSGRLNPAQPRMFTS